MAELAGSESQNVKPNMSSGDWLTAELKPALKPEPAQLDLHPTSLRMSAALPGLNLSGDKAADNQTTPALAAKNLVVDASTDAASKDVKEVGLARWTESNVVNPAANVGADAYNAVVYNTVGKLANSASQVLADKDIMKRAEHREVGEVTGMSKEMVSQAVVSGVGMAIVYVAAGRSMSGLIRAGSNAIGVEAKLAGRVGVENAASFSKTLLSDRTGQIAGSVAYDGLRDVHAGETRLGNMAGSLTAFSIYEKFNPKLGSLNLAPRLGGYALLGAGGAASSKIVADGVSGHITTGDELSRQMLAGGAMNLFIPGLQKAAGFGIGKLNDKLGRGNPVERDMLLTGLAGKSQTLDELAGKVSSLRVKTGQETTNLQGKEVSLAAKGDGSANNSAADRAHEFAHEWFLKSNKEEFAGAARLLKEGDEAGAFARYKQLRLESETYAHKMEAKVASEAGETRVVETNPEKIAALKTPEGISYEEQWKREFERFKATDGKVVAEIDYRDVPTIVAVQSMREVAGQDAKAMKQIMREEYYPGLKKAFPDKSEYEKISTYYEYLLDRGGTWDAVALRGNNGQIVGGIQSQVINVEGKVIKNAVWGEHIWLSPDARSFPNFRALMNTAADRFRTTGSQVAFMEFNDRAKMTLQELIQDAKGGLTTEAREVIWGRFANKGLNILHFKDGKIAPYAQPGMDGQEPVTYLTLALIALDGSNLSGRKLPTNDYLKLLTKAHSTIVDPATDPTVLGYTRELQNRIAAGETNMTFRRLADTTVGRIVTRQFGS